MSVLRELRAGRRATTGTPRPEARGRDDAALWRRARLGAAALAWTGALLGAGVGATIAVPALVARADTARPIGPIEVRFAAAPSWMTEQDLSPLVELVREQLTGSPFDQDGLRVAADALRASGWFESIAQVRRTALGEVEVTAAWVEPTALVRDRDGDHLIDGHGRRLPRSYLSSAAPAFPRVIGAQAPRPDAPGMKYSGGEVPAALALLRALDERPFRSQVAAIDVARHRTDGTLTLISTRDARLRWGHAPGEGTAAEVPTNQKLAYLQFLFDHYGRIDALGEGELDLTGDYVGSRK